jgi:glutamate carboxypeptidase
MTLARLSAAVHERRDAMLEFLEHVVNLDSPSEDKALSDKVGDAFQARGERIGMRFEIDRQEEFADNRIGCLEPANPAAVGPRILMIGHYDTVYAAGATKDWRFRTEGARAYGPGVVDMKGGLVIGLYALEALRDAIDGWSLPVTFIFNSDEEPGSPRSRDVILREAATHDLALVLEPGRPGPSITVGRKGVGIFRMIVSGVEAHAGVEPEKGANSVVEAAHKAVALYALNDFEVGTSVNPGVIDGGTKPYVVPGRCELSTDIRVPTLAEQERILEALDEIASTTHVPGTRTELIGRFHRPPMAATEETWEYVRLIQAVSRSVGYPLGTATSGGASDANLTAAAGVPTIDGLGADGGRAHSPEEYIELDSIERRCQVLAGFLASLADPALRAELTA